METTKFLEYVWLKNKNVSRNPKFKSLTLLGASQYQFTKLKKKDKLIKLFKKIIKLISFLLDKAYEQKLRNKVGILLLLNCHYSVIDW